MNHYMRMIDQNEMDDKIIDVHADDPEISQIQSIDDLTPYTLKEIHNFFEVYTGLENKKVIVEGFKGKADAIKVIKEAIVLYQKNMTSLRKYY